jgi:DNA (cytosine-5)-methyltransferase 1
VRYLSVCSGIEAATVAWHPLGWTPVAFAEIDKFPCAVLAHHYPTVPNWGDLIRFHEWPNATFDLLVGGTPCQSFSVAGLRKGLDDPRGSLLLSYLAVARRYRPRWLVWENVPGVLSVDDGRAFGSLLGGLAELGYGFAYRILDAQYFGLAQRRARVFVVGYLGDWRRAAAVLFERESLSGHPAPRREAGERVAPVIGGCSNGGGANGPGRDVDSCESLIIAPTIPSRRTAGGGLGTDFDCDGGLIPERERALTSSNQRIDYETETLIASTLGAEMGRNRGLGNANEDGPIVPIAFSVKDHGADAGELAPTLRAGGHDRSHANGGVMPAIAFAENQRGELVTSDTLTLTTGGGKPGQGYPAVAFDARQSDVIQYGDKSGPLDTDGHTIAVALRGRDGGGTAELSDIPSALRASQGGGDKAHVLTAMQVRRLTPLECERLQGFPDNYTLIPYNGKPAKDGPRYKALGNSMAVPVMYWIGARIALLEQILKKDAA